MTRKALDQAIRRGDLDEVKRLIEQYGTEVYSTVEEGIPLVLAVEWGHIDIVAYLLDKSSNVNEKSAYTGNTALHEAVRIGRKDIIELLLTHGASVSSKDREKVKSNKLPSELQYLSIQDRNAFHSLLEHGSYQSRKGNVKLVGHQGVGKTTMVRVLRNKKPIRRRQSTEGISVHTYIAAFDMKTKQWTTEVVQLKDILYRDLVTLDKQTGDGRGTNEITEEKNEPIHELSEIQLEEATSALDQERSDCLKRLMCCSKNTESEKFQKSTIAKAKNGVPEKSFVPVNMTDFGGQSVFYSTHQSFLNYRAIYILVIDGGKDFDDFIEAEYLIPGRYGKMTSRDFVKLWVSTIQSYSIGSSADFPKILVVCTHKDKVQEIEADQRIDNIFSEIKKMYTNNPAENHLVLEPKIFLNALNREDEGYDMLKTKLAELICDQPHFGEVLPKAYLYLEKKLNEQKEKIIPISSLKYINNKNPIRPLTDDELYTFLKIHHWQGELIYFRFGTLKEKVVLSPQFIIDALKALITDEQFCDGNRKRQIKSINQNGVLERSDIRHIWEGKKMFIKDEEFLLSLMIHLDIIVPPRVYGLSGELLPSERYFVPSLVKTADDTDYMEGIGPTRALGLSFKFSSEVLPLAIGYRFVSSCINMYKVKEYKGKTMLFSGMVVVSANNYLDLVVIMRSDRIDIFLVHLISVDEIEQSTASNCRECLDNFLWNILDSFHLTSSENLECTKEVVPFHVEIACSDVHSPCYSQNLSSDWTCPHKYKITAAMKSKWYIDRDQILKSRLERNEPLEPRNKKGPEITPIANVSFEPKAKLSDRQLANISRKLTDEQLRNLVLELGLLVEEINIIETDYRGNLENIKLLCLLKWRDKTNGTIQDIIKASRNQGIGENLLNELNRNNAFEIADEVLGKVVTDELIDSIASKVIHSSFMLSIQLGQDASFWIGMKDDNTKILDINRAVLTEWRSQYKGDNMIKDLAQALSNVDFNINCFTRK